MDYSILIYGNFYKLRLICHIRLYSQFIQIFLLNSIDTQWLAPTLVDGEKARVVRKRRPTMMITDDKIQMAKQLHRNLGHASYRILALAVRHGFVRGTTLTFEDLMAINARIDCPACANAKWVQIARPGGTGVRPDNPFHTVSIDKLGPYNPMAYGQCSYANITVDTTTLFGMVHLYKNFSSAQHIDCVENLRLFALQFHF
jgi:hypothetical protein